MRQLASIGALSLLIGLGWFAPFSVHAAVVFSQTPDNENSTAYNGSQPYTFIIIPTAVMPPGTKVKYLQSVFYFGAAKVRVSACTTNVTNPSSDLNPVVTPSNFQNCTAWSDYQDAQDGVNTFALTDEWTVPSVSQTYVIFRFQGDTNYVGLVGGGPAGATDAQTGFTMSGSFTDVPFKPHLVVRDAQISNPSGGLPQVITTGDKPSVLFIPGIEGSELYDGADNKLWTPAAFSNDVPELYMDAQGNSINDIYAKEGDLVRSVPFIGNVYGKMMDDLEDLKQTGQITDYVAAAYDWRLPVDDVLTKGGLHNGRIYYVGPNASTTHPYIISELRRLAREGGKVTIVAHSNGGLVAKRLVQMLGPEAPELIDKVILVASPQIGAPTAIAGALHGEVGQDWRTSAFVQTKAGLRAFASTSPMEAQLLPSSAYFTHVDNPVVTFDSGLTEWIQRYGATIHSQETMDTFLKDTYGRVDARKGPLDTPIQFDPGNSLISEANAFHADLDGWTPPPGIQVIQIAGWGIAKTIAGIHYIATPGGGITYSLDTVVDGDGTVPVPSALWLPQANVTNYWLNLGKFNQDHPFLTGFSTFSPREHGTIFDVDSLRTFIVDTVTNHSSPVSGYGYFSTEVPPSPGKRLQYTLQSPLTLDFFDDKGRHTGISTTTGAIEEQIPGMYYSEIGDVKFAVSDVDTPVHVVMSGYATSTFSFLLDELEGNTVVKSAGFKDMPVTPRTSALVDVGSDIDHVSPLRIDTNGDGVYELTVASKGNKNTSFQLIHGSGGPRDILGFYLGALDETFLAVPTGSGEFGIERKTGLVIPPGAAK